jgi:hypothetical protein
MFTFDELVNVDERLIEKIVDKKVNERLKKVRIPSEAINNAVVKFFTEKSWFLTKDGKKLDTYDLIRKFAMNTIGVAENGEINPEFLKIVREEMAKIIAETSVNATKECKCNDCKCEEDKCNVEEVTYSADDLDEAWFDGVDYAIAEVNAMLENGKYDIKFSIDDDYNIVPDKIEVEDKTKTEVENSIEDFTKSLTPEQVELITKLKSLLDIK